MDLLHHKYQVLEEISSHENLTIFKVKHRQVGSIHCARVVKNQETFDQERMTELKSRLSSLLRFQHERCLPVRDFDFSDENSFFVVTDSVSRENVRTTLIHEAPISWERVFELFHSILDCLVLAEEDSIPHGDIKLETFVVDYKRGGIPRLFFSEFGIDWLLDPLTDPMPSSLTGTPYFSAPEVLQGSSIFNHRADLFSLGVTMYVLLTGRYPYSHYNLKLIMESPNSGPLLDFNKIDSIPDEVKSIFRKLLEFNPSLRQEGAFDLLNEMVEVQNSLSSNQRKKRARSRILKPAKMETSQESSASLKPVEKFSSPRLLILDDDEEILQLLNELFLGNEYDVFTTTSPSSLYKVLYNCNTNIVLVDIMMPVMSGPQICALIRRRIPHIKLILFSNLPEGDIERKAKECNADAFVTKSSGADVIFSTVDKVFQAAKDESEP